MLTLQDTPAQVPDANSKAREWNHFCRDVETGQVNMTRAELIASRIQAEIALRQITQTLRKVKEDAYTHKTYAPRERWSGLNAARSTMASVVQRLNFQIAKRRDEQKAHTAERVQAEQKVATPLVLAKAATRAERAKAFDRVFVDVAKQHVGTELFTQLVTITEARLRFGEPADADTRAAIPAIPVIPVMPVANGDDMSYEYQRVLDELVSPRVWLKICREVRRRYGKPKDNPFYKDDRPMHFGEWAQCVVNGEVNLIRSLRNYGETLHGELLAALSVYLKEKAPA